jgi:endonuclease/exonuclease/phosphatase family metal-dependent hydrolase
MLFFQKLKFGWPAAIATLLAIAGTHAQSLPIVIDSQFDDWTTEAVDFQDATGDGAGIDLLNFSVANDENYLFLRLALANELLLTENNALTLYLDTDNNPLTGKVLNGIGAELEVKFGDREARFYYGNSSFTIGLDNVKFHHLPTVSSEVFEMAIGRDVNLLGNIPLFTGNTVKVLFRDGAADQMPNAGQTFSYQFDDTPTPATELFSLEKENPQHIRLLTWNVLSDGLDDGDRADHFQRVLNVLKPDIVTFNECWDMTAPQVATFMNVAAPLGNFQSWKAVKLDEGNVTVSRFPIQQSWNFYPGHRLTASLIDLPNSIYQKDLLVINGHLRCCTSGNYNRQLEADAFVKFILDAKTPGGVIDLPEGTPFVLSGDLNLVGWRQQLTTLLTGQIVNTGIFGMGGPLDWDGTGLLDVISRQTDQRMAYTWRNDGSSYPPSRIDYHICSNSVMEVEKAFTLQTEIMSTQRLIQYGLQQYDTKSASDHFPKVTDFSLAALTAAKEPSAVGLGLNISPNPTGGPARVVFEMKKNGRANLSLSRADGSTVRVWQEQLNTGQQTIPLDLSGLPSGVYIFEIKTGGQAQRARIVKIE